MDLLSSRYRKPKGRQTKRRRMLAEISRRYHSQKGNDSIAEASSSDIQASCSAISATEGPSCSFSHNYATPEASYILMGTEMWRDLLLQVPCKFCSQCGLQLVQHHSLGYSLKLELLCGSCGESFGTTFSSCREDTNSSFEINNKLVSAFLAIGRGHAALETFSAVLNMPSMDKKTFSKCLHNLSVKNKELKVKMLEISRQIVRESHMSVDSVNTTDILDISVSYDGTWQKRGHTSNLGMGIIIDVLTGLVLDYEILSKYCQDCTVTASDLGAASAEFSIWQSAHQDECEKNFEGSSGSMEMHAAYVMWSRSVKECGMRYTSILSDGDSKTYQFLLENKVYGDITVSKEECLNHVAKRLGTALRNKVKEWRIKKVTLGGRKKGNLTEANILKLQNYYRKAIRQNVPDISKMKSAIYASLKHCSSTDAKPSHSHCPEGASSWCFFQRAIAEGRPIAKHSQMKMFLSQAVVEKIMPVYQRLASEEILKRCVAGKTQNRNESLHSCIWRKCPKEVFVSKKRLEIAVFEAVEEYNLGHVRSLQISTDEAALLENSFSLTIAQRKDRRRKAQKNRCIPKKRAAKNDKAAYAAGAF
nr:uncharacterized protein LOC122273614 [Parasteatoda tepidariorum]